MAPVDDRYLISLLGSAGKAIANQPGAKRAVARMKLADSAQDLVYALQGLDLGLDEPARAKIWEAAADKDRWREVHATLLKSAEMHLIEKFSASS